MGEFMDKSPGNKKKTLLELFGLSTLIDFRQSLKSGSNVAARAAKEAERQLVAESEALDLARDGRDILELARVLAADAQLAHAIDSERDLIDLQLSFVPSRTEPDRPGLVAELVHALSANSNDSSASWNEALQDRTFLSAKTLSALMGAGERALDVWAEDTCPLCQQPKNRDELMQEIKSRIEQLREVDLRVAELRRALDADRERLRSLLAALDRLVTAAPEGGWPDQKKILEIREKLRAHVLVVERARHEMIVVPAAPEADINVAALEEAAQRSLQGDQPLQALARLVRLQERLRRTQKARRYAEATAAVASGIDTVLEATDSEIRREIEQAIQRVGTLAADYYGRLVSARIYSEVVLEYRSGRTGGVEFSLLFDGRHRISPPQRVMSESQLNALGFALFLARLKIDPQLWRTLVLDDVVNSFDASHRVGLARLLAEEFSDWQVVLVTHDRMFVSVARRMLSGWRFAEISAWTPQGGPVLVDGNPREHLRARLAAGSAANELGGLARVALEQALSKPLEKLRFELRYDPLGRYTAMDYLEAVRRGLKVRGSALASLAVLARMEADTYLANLGAHDRPVEPGLTADELTRLVDDLTELEEAFVCTACGDPVWKASLDGGRHHQCSCSALAV